MGSQGTATLNFGATPTFEGSIDVTGQGTILAGSHCEAFWMNETIGEEYDMAKELVSLNCGNVIGGTGFTIYANSKTYATGSISVRWVWN